MSEETGSHDETPVGGSPGLSEAEQQDLTHPDPEEGKRTDKPSPAPGTTEGPANVPEAPLQGSSAPHPPRVHADEIELMPPDHQQVVPGDAEEPMDSKLVYLPRIVSDEFGIQEPSARDMVLLGIVSVGGQRTDTDRGWIALSAIFDKEITVESDIQSVRFTYAP